MKFRIGQGFDVHALVKNRDLILAGVSIPWEKGLEGHSDADVVIHAVIDALLGAAGLGDIGEHFSDADPKWKNCNSRDMLKTIDNLISADHWIIENLDISLLLEAPKISQYKMKMKENLAEDLKISLSKINLKATTTEKLGFLGRSEGIACLAVCLLSRKE